MIQASFFVHNWRTLILSLALIKRFGWKTSDIRFLTTRGFHASVEACGYMSFNLDGFFSIPYNYQGRSALSWQPLRELAKLLRVYGGGTEILFLPHTRDPMMQLVLTSIQPCQLLFIEEGCLFPRIQEARLVSAIEWFDLTACYMLDEHHYFSVPHFLKRRLLGTSRFYGTLDNDNLKGIDTILVSDEDIHSIVKSSLFDGLQGSSQCRDSVVLIGTKDDSAVDILTVLAKHGRRIALRHKKGLCYHPHPSLRITRMSYLNEMSRLHGFHISNIECIDAALFSHSGMILCGDASTITVTARRLGHKYYLLTNTVRDLLPRRVHQEEASVQLMLNKRFVGSKEILIS